MIQQQTILLPQYHRGFHLITSIIKKELGELPATGLLNLLIQHSSAALTLNENTGNKTGKGERCLSNASTSQTS